MYAVPSAPAALENNASDVLQKYIEGAITTLEHLAARAAYAQEPCAQVLFRTAELLRIAVIKR